MAASFMRSALPLPGLQLLKTPCFRDDRGTFCQIFPAPAGAHAGIPHTFVQDNFSISDKTGVLRGLHFQKPPLAQAKLVQVLRGAIFDVAVDIRPASPTFGRYFALTLEADGTQIFIPEGFAHGFQTMADETIVYYKVSKPYAVDCEAGIRWDDPALAIDWPTPPGLRQISEKDRQLPLMQDVA